MSRWADGQREAFHVVERKLCACVCGVPGLCVCVYVCVVCVTYVVICGSVCVCVRACVHSSTFSPLIVCACVVVVGSSVYMIVCSVCSVCSVLFTNNTSEHGVHGSSLHADPEIADLWWMQVGRGRVEFEEAKPLGGVEGILLELSVLAATHQMLLVEHIWWRGDGNAAGHGHYAKGGVELLLLFVVVMIWSAALFLLHRPVYAVPNRNFVLC